MIQKTLYPATRAVSVGKAMHTLVSVPAMSSVFRLVFSMASTHFGLSQALIWPVRAIKTASGLYWWISGMSGPFGPSGTEAVVKVGILARRATLASAHTWLRSVGWSMSRTSWNSPLWWSTSSKTASLGSIIHLL